MTKKNVIIFVLAAAVVAGALVFDGVSRRHAANNAQATQSPAATTQAVDPTNSAAQTDGQTTAATDATPATDDGQNVQPADGTQQDAAAADDSQVQTDAVAAPAPQPLIVPAGTTLTVRLGEDLSSRTSEAGQTFAATLDRDIVVGGQTVIAAGASVTGKVVFARPVGALAGEANLQIKVVAVNVNDANLPVSTAPRSFGPKIKGKNKVGRFMKGLLKRADGQEREVLLEGQTAYSFTLRHSITIG